MEASGHSSIWSGQRVERTNARGRHTYVPAFKRWIVEQTKQPGVSLAGLAMSNQVNANQLRRWVQLHGQQRPDPSAGDLAAGDGCHAAAALAGSLPNGGRGGHGRGGRTVRRGRAGA